VLDHLSDELMSVNLLLRLAPRPFTIAMIASEIPAAIRPYSIAVAPDSSDKKLKTVRFNSTSWLLLVINARRFYRARSKSE
jgi:hypothetical protein